MTILVIGLLQTAIFVAGLLAGYSLQGYKKTQAKSEDDIQNRQWSRSDLPYDAMGDYSDLNIDLVCSDDEIFPKIVDGAKYRINPGDVSNRISFPTSTGMESPDEWYREQFGGNR